MQLDPIHFSVAMLCIHSLPHSSLNAHPTSEGIGYPSLVSLPEWLLRCCSVGGEQKSEAHPMK
jgi:hypothetical protein